MDDDAEGDLVYLVMELLEGVSIEVLRRRAGGHFAAGDAVEVGIRLLDVLARGHAHGVLHGDLKPANLFRTTAPVGLKLLDFGVARILRDRRSADGDEPPPESDHCLGTPAFMAPEQARCRGETLDERTDLWAVGATLFTLLTGEHVHFGNTVTELLHSACLPVSRPVRERLSSAPPELAAIVDRALSFDRNARYASATEMKLACAGCRESLTGTGERSSLFDVETELAGTALMFAKSPDVSIPEEPAASYERTIGSQVGRVRTGYHMGRVGRLWWFHYSGACTEKTWRAYLEFVQQMLDTGEPATFLCLAYQADASSALQRNAMAEFIQRNRHELTRLDRFALVIDSVRHRHAITAIGWLVRKPFEERIFSSPLAAIRWLTEKHVDMDPVAVREAIAGAVPPHLLWSALLGEEPTTLERAW